MTGEAKRDARSAGMDLHTLHRVVCYSPPSFEAKSCLFSTSTHAHAHPRRAPDHGRSKRFPCWRRLIGQPVIVARSMPEK